MEFRKLCWVPSLDALEDAIVLEEWEPYYIDYYTSHYFKCANEIVETYYQDICKGTLDPSSGRVIVFKDAINDRGSLVERAINPIYPGHIQKLNQLLSQVYYLKMLERMDYYNFKKQRYDGYERIFLLEDYRNLQMIFNLNDPVQKQNFVFIQQTVFERMRKRENYYEIIRILLSMRPSEWKSDCILPPMGAYISYSKVDAVDSFVVQKQITKHN